MEPTKGLDSIVPVAVEIGGDEFRREIRLNSIILRGLTQETGKPISQENCFAIVVSAYNLILYDLLTAKNRERRAVGKEN